MTGSDNGIVRLHNLQGKDQEDINDINSVVYCNLGVGISIMETSGSPNDTYYAIGTVNG